MIMINEKFFALPKEKQRRIINAAMEVFGTNDYKKASTDLIALKAGISKGLLFYYFRNKKELYLYLYNYLIEIMNSQVVNEKLLDITDFFELLRTAAVTKLEVLQENPYIMEFSMRAFYSEKEDVSGDLKVISTEQERAIFEQHFKHMDTTKFREGAGDIFHIYKMLRWMADGYLHDRQMSGQPLELDDMMEEFDRWITILKKLTYKEEYQDESLH